MVLWSEGADTDFVHGFRKGIKCLQEPWEAFLELRPFIRESKDVVTVLQSNTAYFHTLQLYQDKNRQKGPDTFGPGRAVSGLAQRSKQARLFMFGLAFSLLKRRNVCTLREADALPFNQQFPHGEQLQPGILAGQVFRLVKAR